VRARLDPLALAGTIRAELLRRDHNMALSKVRPMTAYVQRATAPARFIAVLAGAFAGVGMAFAVDSLDPAFRTPEEVVEYLRAPVLASLPREVA